MSGYKNFAIVGAGTLGNYIIHQFLREKAAGTVNDVVVLTRQGSKTTIEGDARVISVDYSNPESIKSALLGVDVVISTISGTALDVQGKIAEAAQAAGIKLFVPSEFGGVTEGETVGMSGEKASIQDQLKALDIPWAIFYTGPFADFVFADFLNLDVTSGKVSVAGDGNKQISFTSRPDIARYLAHVLTNLPPNQLKNKSFIIEGDRKSFNEIFKGYEEKTGKKLEITYVPVSVFDARVAANPDDLPAVLHQFWATAGPFPRTDNHLYPNWNPSSVVDNLRVE